MLDNSDAGRREGSPRKTAPAQSDPPTEPPTSDAVCVWRQELDALASNPELPQLDDAALARASQRLFEFLDKSTADPYIGTNSDFYRAINYSTDNVVDIDVGDSTTFSDSSTIGGVPANNNCPATSANRVASFYTLENRELVELSGSLKWLNISTGEGFLSCDSTGQDIAINVYYSEEIDPGSISYGMRIHCLAFKSAVGLVAFRILKIDSSQLRSKLLLPAFVANQSDICARWFRAAVKWFSLKRGFGFLRIEETDSDIFVHRATLRKFGFEVIVPGQLLLIRPGRDERGWVVSEVKLAGQSRG